MINKHTKKHHKMVLSILLLHINHSVLNIEKNKGTSLVNSNRIMLIDMPHDV